MSDLEKILEMLGEMGRRMDTVQEDVSALRAVAATKEDVKSLKEDVAATKEDVKSLKEDVAATKEDVKGLKEDVAVLKREMATKEDLQQAKSDMMALMEAYFEPKFDLLAEQFKLIQEKQIPIERMERVEDRLDVAEAAIKSCSMEISNLKKAQ